MSNPYYRSSRDEYPNPFATGRQQQAAPSYDHQYQPQQRQGQQQHNLNQTRGINGNGYPQNQPYRPQEVQEEDFGSAAQQFHHRQNSASQNGNGNGNGNRNGNGNGNGNLNLMNPHLDNTNQERRQNSNQSYRPPISDFPQSNNHHPYPNNPNQPNPYQQTPINNNNFDPVSAHSASYAYAPQSTLTPHSSNPLYSAKNGDASAISLQSLTDEEYLKPVAAKPLLQPPSASYSNPGIERPPSPFDGVYEDRAPKWEKLNPEQRKIAKEFPKDLDEEGTSLWNSMKGILKNWRSFLKWKYTGYYVALILILALVALMTIYHTQIIDWLTPVSKKIKSVSWGWVIPVAILFVVSFPPLFGAEVVIILCGVVYGLWIGFAIVSLGTLLGELGNFWAFMYCLKRTAEKYERKNLNYACMAHITREGGFMVILLARLSAIPGHFTTAVFATVGMNVFVFTLAAILTMPKQLSIVYLGVAIEQSGSGGESTTSKIIKYVVLIISFIVTVWAAWYLYGKMEQARPIVQKRLRARRYTMLSEARKIEKASENTASYGMEDLGAKSQGSKSYGNGGESEDEDEGGMSMKMRVRENHNEPQSAGWKWPGSGGMKSPRAEEENKESHGILREAAPIDRSANYDNESASSGSRSVSPHHGFKNNQQNYQNDNTLVRGQDPNRVERGNKLDDLEEVLREATSPKISSKNQESQPALNSFSPTRPGQNPNGNGLDRNKSYRYATEVGSIYDYPHGSEDQRIDRSESQNRFQYQQDGTPIMRQNVHQNFAAAPPTYASNDSYQNQHQNPTTLNSIRPVPVNQPHRLDTTMSSNADAGWNNHHQLPNVEPTNRILNEEDEFHEPIDTPRWSRIEGPTAL